MTIPLIFAETLQGILIGRRITPTDLPQTVAALHSVVGLAAVMTSIGSVMAGITDISTLHLVTGYLGVLIGIASHSYTQNSLLTFLHRWCNVYWLCGSIYEIGWSNVVETYHSTWPTPGERINVRS